MARNNEGSTGRTRKNRILDGQPTPGIGPLRPGATGSREGRNDMTERRVDRIERILQEFEGRARLKDVLDKLRSVEDNQCIPYQSAYLAVQLENERLEGQGERPKFVTSRNGESRGWVRLEDPEFAAGTAAEKLERRILQQNEKVGADIRTWLQGMTWRTFESSFLTSVLEALGFQNVELTHATRDGGVDARVAYRRGLVQANAIVSAKKWSTKSTVAVAEVRLLRGIQGHEDTAIIITTGGFTTDAKKEARPSQNQRVVYLIDGDQLIDLCKKHQIGVKKVSLPPLLVLDPESQVNESRDELNSSVHEHRARDKTTKSKVTEVNLRDEMLGDGRRGLSVEEAAELSGYSVNTVRSYLSSPTNRKKIGDRIRTDMKARSRALEIVGDRREEFD